MSPTHKRVFWTTVIVCVVAAIFVSYYVFSVPILLNQVCNGNLNSMHRSPFFARSTWKRAVPLIMEQYEQAEAKSVAALSAGNLDIGSFNRAIRCWNTLLNLSNELDRETSKEIEDFLYRKFSEGISDPGAVENYKNHLSGRMAFDKEAVGRYNEVDANVTAVRAEWAQEKLEKSLKEAEDNSESQSDD